MTRALRPRATSSLAVSPLAVTDRTCAAVLGIEPRVFRELLVRESVSHARLGRRVVARVEDVLAALDRLAVAPGDEFGTRVPKADGVEDDDVPDTVDGVLRKLGKERVG